MDRIIDRFDRRRQKKKSKPLFKLKESSESVRNSSQYGNKYQRKMVSPYPLSSIY
jgi:hypothetical protein